MDSRFRLPSQPRLLIALATLAALPSCSTFAVQAGSAQTAASEVSAPCVLSESDQVWLNDAITAWDGALVTAAGADYPEELEVIIFDHACQLTSQTAMIGGPRHWAAEPHQGSVELPTGDSLPVQVVSFAAPADTGSFFVMAAPSIWVSEGVQGGDLALEQLTTAVMLHEAAHALQFSTYGSRVSRLVSLHDLPDDFSDDSIQERFESNEAFANSIVREIDLFLAAAGASDREEAVQLVRRARSLARTRHQLFFGGELLYLAKAEDVWLTLEGSGQWLGYQWLIDREGAGLPAKVAVQGFGLRGKWWSQQQGFASFAALDRLAPGAWEEQAFKEGNKTIGELLDEAIADQMD